MVERSKVIFGNEIAEADYKAACDAEIAAVRAGNRNFKGIGLYRNEPRSMLYSVVSGDDVRGVVRAIHEVDGNAFINTQRTDSLIGRFYRTPQR